MDAQELKRRMVDVQEVLQEFEAEFHGVSTPELLAIYKNVMAAVMADDPAAALPAFSSHIKQLQELAWDKLHLGSWKDVPMVWRDVYSLACLLSACLAMYTPTPHSPTVPSSDLQNQQTGGQLQNSTQSLRWSEGLRDLDLGLMMGGERFSDLLHAAMEASEQARDNHEQLLSMHTTDDQQVNGRPTKRLRTDEDADSTHKNSKDTLNQSHAIKSPEKDGEPVTVSAALLATANLPPGSLQDIPPCLGRVQVIHLPSWEEFLKECMTAGKHGQPAIITGAMDGWPAMTRWHELEYLKQVAGHRTVPVEVGEHYLSEGWGQELMTLSSFIDQHITQLHVAKQQQQHQQQQNLRDEASAPTGRSKNDEENGERPNETVAYTANSHAASDGKLQGRGYLAQHPLFEQIPVLKADVITPEYCMIGKDEEEGGGLQSVNAWFGPAGTITPLHTDPHHNLLCQVVGCKYVRLYSPKQTSAMYPYKEGLTTNSSQVDLHHPDLASFPDFASAPYVDCVLEPGAMLYIPVGWWHFVQSLSVSFSVSYWWQ